MVKGKEYNRSKAIEVFHEAVSKNNEAAGLKALQKASEYFLMNCYKAGIIYEDRYKEMSNMAYGHAVLGESLELYKEAVEWEKNNSNILKRTYNK